MVYIEKDGQLEGVRVYSPVNIICFVLSHSSVPGFEFNWIRADFFVVHLAYFTLTDKIKTIYSILDKKNQKFRAFIVFVYICICVFIYFHISCLSIYNIFINIESEGGYSNSILLK